MSDVLLVTFVWLYSQVGLMAPLLLVMIAGNFLLLYRERRQELRRVKDVERSSRTPSAPEPPRAWPVLGHLPLFASYKNPWEGFDALRRMYGDVFSLRLGVYRVVVLSSVNSVREVLISRASDYGGRPNFHRYHILFGGNRENSLALCEWTPLQRFRRHLAQAHLLPRLGSHFSFTLQNAIREELDIFSECHDEQDRNKVRTKQLLLKLSANIFFKYLCSCRFDFSYQPFHEIVQAYDYVFYDINQSYLMDFIPWMSVMNHGYLNSLSRNASVIRKFIEEEIITRRQLSNRTEEIDDIVEVLLKELATSNPSQFNYNTAIFELEDLIGGSSGVANLCLRAFGYVAQSGEVQDQIRKEVHVILEKREEKFVLLEDRREMPYTEATVLETLRVTSSPIVPHVATVDTEASGYLVEKGTIAVFNNYHLNFGEELWKEPKKFNPRRFLNEKGVICKPDFFFPFSTGRRSCLGYKMVQNITFMLLANLVNQFSFHMEEEDLLKFRSLQFGSLALPLETFSVTFTKR